MNDHPRPFTDSYALLVELIGEEAAHKFYDQLSATGKASIEFPDGTIATIDYTQGESNGQV